MTLVGRSFRSLILSKRIFSSLPKLVKMKLTEEQMKPFSHPGVKILEELFKKNGFEIRIAGGAVRDVLMGKYPGDLDFASAATPDQMKEIFSRDNIRMLNMGGEKHGTITARIEEENFEVTTLRIDKVTDGRRALVEFVTDWKIDAGRRDLTVNAMYLGLDGTVYDYYDGVNHLKQGIVCFVGDPNIRIMEDYLRILRYFRFYGRVSKTPDSHLPQVLSSITNNVSGLGNVSGERLWVEVKKIILGRYGLEMLLKMKECNVYPYIGLTDEFDVENAKRIFRQIEASGLPISECDPATLLASGFKQDEDCMTFVKRVKCSNKQRDVMLFIIKHRDQFFGVKNFKFILDFYVDLIYKEKMEKKVALFMLKESLRYTSNIELLKEFDDAHFPVFPVKGNMIVDYVKNEKEFKPILRKLLHFWKESDYTLQAEELIKKLAS